MAPKVRKIQPPKPPHDLHQEALQARENSYSPYSRYAVGSAIRTASGDVFSGCNVENSSYGAGCCAERVAIQKAISETGKIAISEVLVVTQSTPPGPPCGICLQVIVEFAEKPTIPVHLCNAKGAYRPMKLNELLPEPFVPRYLLRKKKK